jgi:hypothetical protein
MYEHLDNATYNHSALCFLERRVTAMDNPFKPVVLSCITILSLIGKAVLFGNARHNAFRALATTDWILVSWSLFEPDGDGRGNVIMGPGFPLRRPVACEE